jgi:integrase
MGSMPRDPCGPITAPRFNRYEIRTLDVGGVSALLRAAAGTWLRLPIAVLVGTGLRRGELFGLKWSDIDLEACRLTVRRSVEMVRGVRREKPPKTVRSARTIALAPFVVAALQARKAEQILTFTVLLGDLEARRRQKEAYVFDRADGTVPNPDSFSWAFADLVRRSKLPKVRLHDLRHSHATIALAVGTDLKTISAALGHSTISVTADIYLHSVASLETSHAARIDTTLGDAVNDALGSPPPVSLRDSVPQRCHTRQATTKKPRGYTVSDIAPTGFESAAPTLAELRGAVQTFAA